MAAHRDFRGRFKSKNIKTSKQCEYSGVIEDHNYCSAHLCDGLDCVFPSCPFRNNINLGKYVSRSGWREGRRLVEFEVLLSGLKSCKFCGLGPVPLTLYNIVGEMQKGLGGYLYVKCQNSDCMEVNRVPYGKTHREKKTGMPSFVANTKLGTSMVDCVGGPDRVNNLLTTLNLKPINHKNLKVMERRAGAKIETVAYKSTKQAANDSFRMEMNDVAVEEIEESKARMGDTIDDDLQVSVLPESSPSVRKYLMRHSTVDGISSDEDDQIEPGNSVIDRDFPQLNTAASTETPVNNPAVEARILQTPGAPRDSRYRCLSTRKSRRTRCQLSAKFPCKTRTGMSCAVDTAWHKRGFDSLTSHTFFMSKAKYGKKVLKTMVAHRTCGTCKWWRKNRPFQKVRKHRCVFNHVGSARMMESVSGVKAVKQLAEDGTPVEYIEGDGDNTLIAHLRNEKITVKKRYDRNHIVKNIGKNLYSIQNRNKKLSKSVITHIQKCLKYAFAKNQGESLHLEENLKALIPHQFGDHSQCQPRFCGFKRQPNDTYRHRSLPYKAALKDDLLREELDRVFQPVISSAEQYADLGSSQQCEHANREVTLRAPKMLHYGNSESLDFRVHATSAFINEGRHYISQANVEAGLSPGKFTEQYAKKQMERRHRVQEKSQLPSTKRRRLILKQERAITQGACEVLEGQSYDSGIGLVAEPDIEQIPEAVPRGTFKPVTLPLSQEPSLITFDLETTDLIRGRQMPHITQIAANELESGSVFNVYVKPDVPITSSAQQVTGISVSPSGQMSVSGQPVQCESVKNAVNKFITWLEKFPNIILIAHNGKRFDFPVLSSVLENIGNTDKFCSTILGVVDSLHLFKKAFPDFGSYKQEDLVREILRTSYEAHNAVADVKALGQLVSFVNSGTPQLISHSFTFMAVLHQYHFNEMKAKNIESLRRLVANGVMKLTTAENVAGSGLNIHHLKKIFERDGEDGLLNTFTCKNKEGQPRVTNVKRTLESVIPKLTEYLRQELA